jgi:hypothetical protein
MVGAGCVCDCPRFTVANCCFSVTFWSKLKEHHRIEHTSSTARHIRADEVKDQ